MLTLFGSLLGFITSIFPDVMRLFQDKIDRQHELEMFDRQLKMMKIGQRHHMDQLQIQADMVEIDALHRPLPPSGHGWVDALSGSVRPIITYTFFFIYAALKIAQGSILLGAVDHIRWDQLLVRLWHEEDQTLFAAVISFWFGHRAFRKTLATHRAPTRTRF